jgi:hypothetical protein
MSSSSSVSRDNDNGPLSRNTKKKKSRSSSSSSTYVPPKPLTAEELKVKIASVPGEIKSFESSAKDANKQFYILSVCTIIVLIIWICVYIFVPDTYIEEVEVEEIKITSKGREIVKKKVPAEKTANLSWGLPLVVLFCNVCCLCYVYA